MYFLKAENYLQIKLMKKVIRRGDVLQDSDVKRAIIHVCNDQGTFNKGFAKELARKYPIAKQKYVEWYKENQLNSETYKDKQYIYKFQLGSIQEVKINDNLSILNMVCQKSYKSTSNPQPLSYYHLSKCLKLVSDTFTENTEIWAPYLIGCGLAGGKQSTVRQLLKEELPNHVVILFKL